MPGRRPSVDRRKDGHSQTVIFPKKLFEALDVLSRRERQTLSALVRTACRAYVLDFNRFAPEGGRVPLDDEANS